MAAEIQRSVQRRRLRTATGDDPNYELSGTYVGLVSSVPVELKYRIVMVGTHLTRTRGGISTLISGVLNSRFGDRFDVSYIESQAEDHGKVRKAALAAGAIVRFLWRLATGRRDLVYVHLGSNASLYRESLFIYLAKLLKKKVIAHFHAGDVDLYLPQQPKLGQRYIAGALDRCDRLIAVSRGSAKQIAQLTDPSKIVVIPNAIDTSALSPRIRSRADGAPVRILFVGAMGKLKGETDLVDALSILKRDRTNFAASFLGYGGEALERYAKDSGIADRIEYIGAVAMNQRHRFFQEADIFVLPTYAEAMPMAVMEAMAAGLAVITTRVGGIPELVDDGENGLLYECGDVVALTEKLTLLANNASLRMKLGRKAAEKARRDFDIGSYSERLTTYVSEFISSEGRS